MATLFLRGEPEAFESAMGDGRIILTLGKSSLGQGTHINLERAEAIAIRDALDAALTAEATTHGQPMKAA